MATCTPVVYVRPEGKLPGRYQGLSVLDCKLVSSSYPSWNHPVEHRTVKEYLDNLGLDNNFDNQIICRIRPVTNLIIGSVHCELCITFYRNETTRFDDGFSSVYIGTDSDTGNKTFTTWGK